MCEHVDIKFLLDFLHSHYLRHTFRFVFIIIYFFIILSNGVLLSYKGSIGAVLSALTLLFFDNLFSRLRKLMP